jgi:AGZA family xanthine/uracil permease-like MFS transporter
MLDKYFNYKKHKTDFKTEVIAGVTTFLTMAYIMFLNPFILSGEFAGPEKGFFEFGAVYTATILATALACFIMAFYGKTWPIGLHLAWELMLLLHLVFVLEWAIHLKKLWVLY